MSGINTLLDIFKGSRSKKTATAAELADRASKVPQTIIVNRTTVRPIRRGSQDITKWRQALVAAESETDQRYLLYELYMDMLLDGFMLRQKEKRIDAITNTDLTFTVDGTPVKEVEDLQRRMYFQDLLRHVMDTRFWGHTLLELYWPQFGDEAGAGRTYLVNRMHVKPRLGVVTRERWEITGIEYRKPPYSRVTLEVGKDDDLGLLLPVSQYVIYKRGNFGDWAEFAEVFGMPFRWATYNSEHSREILEKAMDEAGSAGYVVAPEDAKLQFFNPTSGAQSNDIFRFLRDACNEEISITILGNSMTTTEARQSGYAQSKTHSETQEEVHKADRRWVLRILNEKLNPYLESIGYPVKGGHWGYEEEDTLSLTERLNVDMQVSSKVAIPDSYWYEKYKIPKPEEGEPSSGGSGSDAAKKKAVSSDSSNS